MNSFTECWTVLEELNQTAFSSTIPATRELPTTRELVMEMYILQQTIDDLNYQNESESSVE